MICKQVKRNTLANSWILFVESAMEILWQFVMFLRIPHISFCEELGIEFGSAVNQYRKTGDQWVSCVHVEHQNRFGIYGNNKITFYLIYRFNLSFASKQVNKSSFFIPIEGLKQIFREHGKHEIHRRFQHSTRIKYPICICRLLSTLVSHQKVLS